jgi:hypothetical protein
MTPNDLIDQQARTREQIRKLEIGPRRQLEHTTAPWDPAYGPLTFLELVAYTMLPFCAFEPHTLPAIPPQAQHYAQEWWSTRAYSGALDPVRREQTRYADDWDYGYREARAFTRALLCAHGLQLPFRYATWPTNVHRVEGQYTDPGPGWRTQPNGRALSWTAVAADVIPPAVQLPDAEAPAYFWNLIELRLGDPSPLLGDPDDPAARTEYNYPPDGEFAGDPSYTGAGTGRYCYQAQPQYQLLTVGNPGYPGGECKTTDAPPYRWGPAQTSTSPYGAGTYDLSGPHREHIACLENHVDLATTTGAWNIAEYQLDALAGLYLDRPPEFYMGEPHQEFSRSAAGSGALIVYPGWAQWLGRIQAWCLDTPDWMSWVAPFFSHYRPRWRQPGLPSEHWQRMPVYMPWLGWVEYRIWQSVIYLRGRLYNPFYWGNSDIAPMPPGVAPQSVQGKVPVSGSDNQPYPLGVRPADGTRPLRLAIAGSSEMNPPGSRAATPDYLVLDGARFPVKRNPPYVP